MSWCINFDLYTKKGNNWKNVFHDKNYDALKVFSTYRGDIENFSETYLVEEDKEILNTLIREYDYTDYVCIGSLTKETYANLDVKTRIEANEGKRYIVVSEEDEEKVKEVSISSDNYLKLSKEERDVLIDLYVVKTEQRGYGKGIFCRIDTFIKLLNTEKENYIKLLNQKFRYENLKFSVDYLKLDEEEKGRVEEEINSNCEGLDEQISEVEQKLSALNGMIAILEVAYQDNNDAVIYIYSE